MAHIQTAEKRVPLDIDVVSIPFDLLGMFTEKVFSVARTMGLDLQVSILGVRFRDDKADWCRVEVNAPEAEKEQAEMQLVIPLDDWTAS